MKVNIGTLEINDDLRKLIRISMGLSGKATAKEVRKFYIIAGNSRLVDIRSREDERE